MSAALDITRGAQEGGLVSFTGQMPPGVWLERGEEETSLRIEAGQCLALAPMELTRDGAVPLRIELGESARLTLIERLGPKVETRIELAPQAKLVHGLISSEESDTRVFVTARSGAFYDAFMIATGKQDRACALDVALAGEMAGARLSGVQILRGAAQTSARWRVRHEAPHTQSRQKLRSVLTGEANALFVGEILVARGAHKADGRQTSRALLLSDRARMESRPELEIYEDDVKCSHGATLGALDRDALFYLRARGVNEKRAGAILVRAFVEQIIGQVQSAELAQAARAETERMEL